MGSTIRGSQLGPVMQIVVEALMDGKDVGVSRDERSNIAVVVPKNETNVWLHKVDPFGRHVRSVKRISELGVN